MRIASSVLFVEWRMRESAYTACTCAHTTVTSSILPPLYFLPCRAAFSEKGVRSNRLRACRFASETRCCARRFRASASRSTGSLLPLLLLLLRGLRGVSGVEPTASATGMCGIEEEEEDDAGEDEAGEDGDRVEEESEEAMESTDGMPVEAEAAVGAAAAPVAAAASCAPGHPLWNSCLCASLSTNCSMTCTVLSSNTLSKYPSVASTMISPTLTLFSPRIAASGSSPVSCPSWKGQFQRCCCSLVRRKGVRSP